MEGSAGGGGLTRGWKVANLIVVVGLTLLTQVGGVLWLFATLPLYVMSASWRTRLFVASVAVGVLFAGGLHKVGLGAAELSGRVPLPGCEGPNVSRDYSDRIQPAVSAICRLQRHYVSPRTRAVLRDLADAMRARPNGDPDLHAVRIRYLDANFPAIDGFPLLPHLSHDDGRKVDRAFFYRDRKGPVDAVRSRTLGHWAFEQPRRGDPRPCERHHDRLTMRWDMAWFPTRDFALDEERTARMIRLLAADSRVTKILLEPYLVRRLGLAHPKVRFQGCRAARHDDHIHSEVR